MIECECDIEGNKKRVHLISGETGRGLDDITGRAPPPSLPYCSLSGVASGVHTNTHTHTAALFCTLIESQFRRKALTCQKSNY